jgi:hypothetical protein
MTVYKNLNQNHDLLKLLCHKNVGNNLKLYKIQIVTCHFICNFNIFIIIIIINFLYVYNNTNIKNESDIYCYYK